MLTKNKCSPDATFFEEKRGSHLIRFFAFSDCQECNGKGYIYQGKFPREYDAKQCFSCFKRNEEWKRSYPIFYRISTVSSCSLNKQVIPGKIIVRGYAEIDGDHEILAMEYTDRSWHYEKECSTLEEAQAWIASQHNSNISAFWKGM